MDLGINFDLTDAFVMKMSHDNTVMCSLIWLLLIGKISKQVPVI